jgi:hypothetical protein
MKITSALTRLSPCNMGPRPARTSSKSSVENTVNPKVLKKSKRDLALSVTTGSDVFSPTDVNMAIDTGESIEVSTAFHGKSVKTKMTCLVQPASQMMHVFHFLEGTCGSRHMWPIPMPTNSVDYNVTLLRADAGCMTGHNSCLSPSSYKS